jgi:hypothetical protein
VTEKENGMRRFGFKTGAATEEGVSMSGTNGRTRRALKAFLPLLVVVVAALAFAGMAGAATLGDTAASSTPWIQSDQGDYAPGALVTLTGGNWAAGESVHINVNDDQSKTWSRDVDVTAASDGTITDSFNLPTTFIATYAVTATAASGTATASFTDGNVTLALATADQASPPPSSYATTYVDYAGTGSAPNTNCSDTGTTKSVSSPTGIGVGTNSSVKLVSATVSGYSFNYFSSSDSSTHLTGLCISGTTGGQTIYLHFTKNVPLDTTPPTLHLPADMTAEATGASGAVVTYTASADDADPAHPAVSCDATSGSTFPIGTTTVHCSATDTANNTASGSFQVTVQDTTAPTLHNVPQDMTLEATNPTGAAATWSVITASDAVDGSDTVTCDHNSGGGFPIATTKVTCSATDAHHNTTSASFDVTVQDTTAPAIGNVPADITEEATSSSGAVATRTNPTASDAVDGAVTVTCDHSSGDTFGLGTTKVTCSSTDAHNNTGSASFDVTVQDTTPPSITGTPSGVTVEATGPGGAPVTYTSPTASDLVDGAVAVSCSPASGSTFVLGSTQVTCSAQDNAGNSASTHFDVEVQDTTPPSITGTPSGVTVEATGPGGAPVTYTSPTASDLVDGAVAVSCSPASGSTFVLGSTQVTCSAQDNAGNSASTHFDVTVEDTTPPDLTVSSDIVKEATGPSGAAVSFVATAHDLVDPSPSVTCKVGSTTVHSGDTFALGTVTVSCAAKDASNNVSTAQTFDVTVQDTTGPALTLPSNIIVTAATNSGKVVTYSASATDLVDGPVSITCVPASGSTFSVGSTTVNCSAVDSRNNSTTGSFTITVDYSWTGFFQPIDNEPACNSVKAGSAIPVKFSLSGYQGMSVIASGYPAVSAGSCAGAALDPVEETVTAGNSSLSYDATTDQYVYVWKTDKSWAGQAKRLTVKLADGSVHYARFSFTK